MYTWYITIFYTYRALRVEVETHKYARMYSGCMECKSQTQSRKFLAIDHESNASQSCGNSQQAFCPR